MPAKAHVPWVRHIPGTDDHDFPIDVRFGSYEFFICSSDLEFVKRISVTRFQAFGNMGKSDENLVSLDFHRFVKGAGVDDVLYLIAFGEGPASEAIANVTLVSGMDVFDVVDDISGHGHSGMRDFEGGALGLPKCRELSGGIAFICPRRDLNEVEGHVLVFEGRAPTFDESLHFSGVGEAIILDDVGFALIPNGAPDLEPGDWSNHSVVHFSGGGVAHDPGFDGRASPGAIDESNRDISFLMEFFPKVVENSREIRDGFGCGCFPGGFDIGSGGIGLHLWNMEEANVGMIGALNEFLPLLGSLEGPFHV